MKTQNEDKGEIFQVRISLKPLSVLHIIFDFFSLSDSSLRIYYFMKNRVC